VEVDSEDTLEDKGTILVEVEDTILEVASEEVQATILEEVTTTQEGSTQVEDSEVAQLEEVLEVQEDQAVLRHQLHPNLTEEVN